MDPSKRISELEAQVDELTRELRALRAGSASASGEVRGQAGSERVAGEGFHGPSHPQRRVSASHAGGVWIGRGAVVVLMTAIILGTVLGLGTDALEAVHKGTTAFLYALLACAVLGAAALLFLALHRRIMLTWLALIATYLAYVFYFQTKPEHLAVPEDTYFWLSMAFLSLCYLVFCAATIMESARSDDHRGVAALMAAVNSVLYVGLGRAAVLKQYAGSEALFLLGIAGFLGFMALLTKAAGPRATILFQLVAAKGVLLLTWALYLLVPAGYLFVAVAAECVPLAVLFKRTGAVVFRLLGYLLAGIGFAGCLASTKIAGDVQLGSYSVPANWFCCSSVAGILMVAAWCHERLTFRVHPSVELARRSWLVRGQALAMQGATSAMAYAAAGALILAAATVMNQGGKPGLPYFLGAEGFAVVVMGFLLRTPQIEVASMVLVVAAHVTYHFFVLVGQPGFEAQPNYGLYTVLLVALTYLVGALWERYLHRVSGERPWEHDLIACGPHLAATLMLAVLIGRALEGIYGPLAQNGLGVALLIIGGMTAYPGLHVSGVFALAIGSATFFARLYGPPPGLLTQNHFLPCLVLTLTTYSIGERVLALLKRRRHGGTSRFHDVMRTALVAAAGALGILAANEWANQEYLTLFWLGHAAAGLALGIIFWEARYVWAAFLILGLAILRALRYDIQILPQPYQYVAGGFLLAALVIVGWIWGWRRLKDRQPASTDHAHGTPSDG